MKSPAVSICIPAYRQTELLERLLQSISVQTFKDFEVIVTDDTPGPEVEQLAGRYKEVLPIHYHRNEVRLGSPKNWNRAIELSKGEIIKIMHHDDWFSQPGSLEKFVRALDDKSIDFVFCTTEIHHAKSGAVTYNRPDADFLKNMSAEARVLFHTNLVGPPSSTAYRRSINIEFDNALSYVVDVDFYMLVLERGHRFAFINEPLIANTAQLDSQVTAHSLTLEIQIGEYCYLYNKHYPNMLPTPELRKFFEQLFQQFGLRNFGQITRAGWPHPQPRWAFKKILWQLKWKRLTA